MSVIYFRHKVKYIFLNVKYFVHFFCFDVIISFQLLMQQALENTRSQWKVMEDDGKR